MIKPLLDILTGLFALIVQMIYFIKDDRTENNDPKNEGFSLRWHIAGGVLHGWMYYNMQELYGMEWGLLMASLTWYFFDGCINAFVLKKEFFYIGKTALIDKAQQWIGKTVGTDPRFISALLKHFLLLGSIMLLIKKLSNG